MIFRLDSVIADAETKKSDILWTGESDIVTFKDLEAALAAKPEDDRNVDIIINCPGGSCIEGLAMYDEFRSLEGHVISALVKGECSSMATIVLLAASVRKALPNSRFCIHKPRFADYYAPTMTEDDAKRLYEDLHSETERLKKIYLERTSMTAEQLEELMLADKYITAEEALKYGVITEIIQPMTASKTNHITAMKKTELKAWQKKAMCAIGLAHLVAELEEQSIVAMTLNTEDGSTIKVEREEGEPQVGDAATPDGEHKMADGTTIVIADGIITEIKPAEEQVEEEVEKEADETAEAIKAMKEEIDALTAENEDLKAQLSASKANEKSAQDIETLQLVSNAGGIEWLKSLKSEHKPAGRTAPQSTEKMSSLSERLAAKKEELKNKNKKQK